MDRTHASHRVVRMYSILTANHNLGICSITFHSLNLHLQWYI